MAECSKALLLTLTLTTTQVRIPAGLPFMTFLYIIEKNRLINMVITNKVQLLNGSYSKDKCSCKTTCKHVQPAEKKPFLIDKSRAWLS